MNAIFYLFVYIVILLLGIVSYYLQSSHLVEHIWDYWGVVDTSSAVALAILAGVAYYEYVKGDNEIKIYFKIGKKEIDTKLSILRKEFSRSEILGLLGMIQKDPQHRFKLAYFQDTSVLKDIQEIQKGNGKKLMIKLQKNEFDYFDIKS